MSLQSRLDEMKSKFEASAPPETLAIMHKATKSINVSGLADRAMSVGERAPDFRLQDVNGEPISLQDALAGGPVIVNFYRGVW